MAVKIVMPKLGMTMAEGVVAKWLVADGAPVEQDQVVAEVMSQKITYEVKAPASGILRRVVETDQPVPVGSPIGYVTAAGEALPEEPVAAAPEPALAAAPAGPGRGNGPAGGPAAPRVVLATPMAKRLAREHGVDLAAIVGSGPGGRIQERDVLAYIEGRAGRIAAAAPAAREAPAQPTRPEPAVASIPFAGLRQAVARNVMASLSSTAQVTLVTEADVTAFVELLERLRRGSEITATTLIVKVAAAALRRHPRLNATLVEDQIRLLPDVNIGVAVALEDGLIAPVLRHADRMSVYEIDRELKRLSAAARGGTLTVDEVTGGTFTITNLGMYGVDAFTPIINLPEVAILGIGRIVDKPAIYRGEIAKRSMMTLSLTFDHRLVDGAPAADFLRTAREMLEQPAFALAGEALEQAEQAPVARAAR